MLSGIRSSTIQAFLSSAYRFSWTLLRRSRRSSSYKVGHNFFCPSYHKRFYQEYGLLEYELSLPPPEDLSFTLNSNPVNSPSFFMLMIEPPPEKVQFSLANLIIFDSIRMTNLTLCRGKLELPTFLGGSTVSNVSNLKNRSDTF